MSSKRTCPLTQAPSWRPDQHCMHAKKVRIDFPLKLLFSSSTRLTENIFIDTSTIYTYLWLETVMLMLVSKNYHAQWSVLHTSDDTGRWITFVSLIVCLFAMNLGMESLPWQLCSEYFPTTIRSQVTRGAGYLARGFFYLQQARGNWKCGWCGGAGEWDYTGSCASVTGVGGVVNGGCSNSVGLARDYRLVMGGCLGPV